MELDFRFNQGAPGSSGIISGGHEGGTQKVRTKTLDSAVGGRTGGFDILIFKMDVEGAEEEVLRGASGILASGKETYLMVEDFVRPRIVDYLEGIGAEFILKLTPYNSFWKLGGNPPEKTSAGA
jgi:hypothetical protein